MVMIPYPFPRVALFKPGYLAPVHATSTGLGNVYRSLVKALFPTALDAVGERKDERRNVAAVTSVHSQKQKRSGESEKCRAHVYSVNFSQFYLEFLLNILYEETGYPSPKHAPKQLHGCLPCDGIERDWYRIRGKASETRGSMKLQLNCVCPQASGGVLRTMGSLRPGVWA